MKQLDNLSQEQGYKVSDKYKVIDTTEILSQFEAAGYEVTSVQKTRVNKPEKEGFQKHLIRLAYPDNNLKIDGLRPELILKNAYDGSSSFRLKIGVFRLICSNGLEVGTTYQSESVRHIGDNVMEQVLEGANRIKTQFPLMSEQIKLMQNVTLSDAEMHRFSQIIGKALLAGKDNVIQTDFSGLLKVRRSGDANPDAFSVLNVIQENALNGNYKYLSEVINPNYPKETTQRLNSGRRIRSLDKTSQINTLVWDKALELISA